MKFLPAALAFAVGLATAATAAPANSTAIDTVSLENRAARSDCGQYKFDDGTVQYFYSQVWAGYSADKVICRWFKYEFRDKKGQEGKMVAAKVDKGCTCFFYE
jgi:hypothetical protein